MQTRTQFIPITRNTTTEDLAENAPQTSRIFESFGIGSIGSLFAFYDTVGEIATAHGIDPDELAASLNAFQVRAYRRLA